MNQIWKIPSSIFLFSNVVSTLNGGIANFEWGA